MDCLLGKEFTVSIFNLPGAIYNLPNRLPTIDNSHDCTFVILKNKRRLYIDIMLSGSCQSTKRFILMSSDTDGLAEDQAAIARTSLLDQNFQQQAEKNKAEKTNQ